MPLLHTDIDEWYFLSLSMGICFIICITLIILQIKSIRWYSVFMNDDNLFHILIVASSREHFCLYAAYFIASLCSMQCLLNHISNYFPEWYCTYGMGACVILHEAAKTFGYGFFLERARSAIKATQTEAFPSILTKYILPVWIIFYFILYSILCPLTFRGLSHDPFKEDGIPTACLFDKYESWVFFLSIGVEVFNSVLFVILFAYPLWIASNIDNPQVSVINIIKYNIIFSSVSCISSVTFLIYRALSRNNTLAHYLWLAGNIDLVINAICTFLMITANRMYVGSLYSEIRDVCRVSCCKLINDDVDITKDNNCIEEYRNENINQVEHISLVGTDSKMRTQTLDANGKKISRNNSACNNEESSTANISHPRLNKSMTPYNLSSTLGHIPAGTLQVQVSAVI